MEIKVDIQPDQINETIAQAVIQSTLGDAIKQRIEKFLNGERSYGSPSLNKEMEGAVDTVIRDIVMNLIRTEYKDKIVASIKEKMTDDMMDRLISSAMDAWMKKNSSY